MLKMQHGITIPMFAISNAMAACPPLKDNDHEQYQSELPQNVEQC